MHLSPTLILICLTNTLGKEWSFEDQDCWGEEYPECDGDRQSPIDIDMNCVIINPSLYLNFVNYGKAYKNAIVYNNGHTVKVTLNPKTNIRPHITGSAVNGKYIFEEFHFHWTNNNFDGVEHAFNDIKGSAELHLVHYNEKYGNYERASERKDGVVVLAVILKVANYASLGFIPIIKVLPLITDCNSSVVINQKFILLENFLPFRKDFFYRYEGSLTTPPCYETVTWIVFGQHIKISPLMLFLLRRLYEKPNNGWKRRMISTTRDIQPLNGRIVEASEPL